MFRRFIKQLRRYRSRPQPCTDLARLEVQSDRLGYLGEDRGNAVCIAAALDWLARAQDQSASQDGGVARAYSLNRGWQPSYPETTGYIIPTYLEQSVRLDNADLSRRAKRMLDWLVWIQMPGGGFQGGVIGGEPKQPVAFNTGQILLGLAAGEQVFGRYREALTSAAGWLVQIQARDGGWPAFTSPFASPGAKTFDTHIAWGLFAADQVVPGHGYADAAMANTRWAVAQQSSVGWFSKCCLTDATQPLTHTLGYALRGVLEAHLHTGDRAALESALRCARGMLTALQPNGFLPGRLRSNWSPAAEWACVTGTAQTAYCWLRLFQLTGDSSLLKAGQLANQFVRRTMKFGDNPDTAGAVKASVPVNGDYNGYEYLNWAAKFAIDSFALEMSLQCKSPSP